MYQTIGFDLKKGNKCDKDVLVQQKELLTENEVICMMTCSKLYTYSTEPNIRVKSAAVTKLQTNYKNMPFDFLIVKKDISSDGTAVKLLSYKTSQHQN